MSYQRRIIDDELDALFPHLAAIALEGPKGVGKTATGLERARSTLHLDDPLQQSLLGADPTRLDLLETPVLLDEWQRYPRSWDLVRRSVDADSTGGRFLLAGSATPPELPMHSGAGRIVRLKMRPLSIVERNIAEPTVSLAAFLTQGVNAVGGDSPVRLADYVDEIVASGMPAIRGLPPQPRAKQLDSYLERIADVEFAEQGVRVNRPASLRAWMMAYAAATASTASYETILDAATPGESNKPAKTTALRYRDVLSRLWILDPIPGWYPAGNLLTRLAQAPKHHLVDPGFAARLVGATASSLLSGQVLQGAKNTDEGFVGALFESLVAQSVRVYAQRASATVHHLRTRNGDHEVDLIVEGEDRRIVAIEVKLSPDISDRDVRHLLWMQSQLGDRVAAAVIVTTGQYAYRRSDGIFVVPAALLGP